jgi:hypothetical protein
MSLPLDTFRSVFGFHPWHFYQLTNDKVPLSIGCDTLVSEHSWQATDAVGRAEIRDAIEMAEQRLADEIGAYPYPRATYVDIPFPQFFDVTDQYRLSVDTWGRWLAFRLPYAQPLTIGKLTHALIGTGNVAFSDEDGDGVAETFTATIATIETDATLLGAYIAVADRIGADKDASHERWRLQPVSITVASGNATITGPSYLLVKPAKQQAVRLQALDPADTSNLVTSIALYRAAYDTTQQGEFIWESGPDGECASVGADPSAIGTSAARFVIRDPDLGYIAGEAAEYSTPASSYIAVEWPYDWAPSRVRVHYKSGYDSRALTLAICRMAAAELARPICACQQAYREFSSWQQDLALVGGDNAVAVSQQDLDNPFGTRRGHIYAWKMAQQYKTSRVSISG